MTCQAAEEPSPMLNALRTTVFFIPHVPALIAVGWAAGRRGGRTVIAIDAGMSNYAAKKAMLTALTDEEYVAFEQTLPVAEQQRRIELTWAWRHLSRRHAMLVHLEQYDEDTYPLYEADLPLSERERRVNSRAAGYMGSQPTGDVAFA